MEPLKDIVIIYHAQCRDGFGAAYAAWTVFGNTASYLPRKTQEPVPEGLIDKEIYILDYSYPAPELAALKAANRKVIVIDHHETAREAVAGLADSVFDVTHSGSVLAWQYFHPDTPTPKLLLYVEDQDLWRNSMEHSREFGAALGEYTQDFETWHQLNQNLEDRLHFNKFIEHGEILSRFEAGIVEKLFQFRERVHFAGHEVYAVNASRLFRSPLGHRLAEANRAEGGPGIGIVYYRYDGMVHCSLRSVTGVDVHTIAEQHGGGGHPNAASIRVSTFAELPFTPI